MKRSIPYLIALLFGIAGCSSDTSYGQDPTNGSVSGDSVKADPPPPLSEGLEMWQNMEQIEYCVPVPLEEYPLSKEETTRGQFVFRKPQDSLSFVELRGLFRSDPSVSLETYFTQTYSGAEAQGKLVSEKYLKKAGNRFWAEGTWSNLTGYHFLEITWLRQDDVVSLEALFPEADTAIWHRRRDIIIGYPSTCE